MWLFAVKSWKDLLVGGWEREAIRCETFFTAGGVLEVEVLGWLNISVLSCVTEFEMKEEKKDALCWLTDWILDLFARSWTALLPTDAHAYMSCHLPASRQQAVQLLHHD